MKKTGFLYDERYMLHDTGDMHPETSDRLPALYKGIEKADFLQNLKLLKASTTDLKWLETVHENKYIERIKQACLDGNNMIDFPDNAVCKKTYDIALLAVGGILDTIDMLMNGEIDNAFCAVRPPGHHAEKDACMGFCYFNNIAIAARYLQQKWKLNNIAIVDFDVHHGNGTQHIFEDDPSVFYYSIHEHPSFSFPGTGREFETGIGNGMGYTLNSPLLPGMGDEEYKTAMQESLDPVFFDFLPDFLLVSAGFDSHKDDDMSDMEVTTDGFRWIIEKLNDLANTYCEGKIIYILEGGYNLERLPELGQLLIELLLNQ